MVLSWGKGGTPPSGANISELIAKKQYAKAIEAIRAQVQAGKHNPQLHIQLADVLVMAGKNKEAVQILSRVAEEFAAEGFDTKAIAVLKKIEKIEPGRYETRAKLDSLVRKGRHEAPNVATSNNPGFEIGMEEIGMDAPAHSVRSEPAPPPPAPSVSRPPAPRPPVPPPPRPEPEPAIDLGIDFGADAPPAGDSFSLDDSAPLDLGLEPPAPEPVKAVPRAAPPRAPKPGPAPKPPSPAPVEDLDFGTGEDEEEPLPVEVSPLELEPELEALPQLEPEVEPEVEPTIELSEVEVEAVPPAELPAGGDSSGGLFDDLFTQELMGVIDEVFQAVGDEPVATGAVGSSGDDLANNPLFRGFSQDELGAVIQGLNLLTYEAGDIILSQGAPGNSLFILTTGSVKAFVREESGNYGMVSELDEGSFFGEVSILTGMPRTATIIATSHVELLELDRGTLDAIAIAHPHVMQVLEDFYRERTQSR